MSSSGTLSIAAAQASSSQTRHARRIYIGNLPQGVEEKEIKGYFEGMIAERMQFGEEFNGNKNIASVYINHDRHFCFIEFYSIEIAAACMALDGAPLPNRGALKIRRPNDYNADLVDPRMRVRELVFLFSCFLFLFSFLVFLRLFLSDLGITSFLSPPSFFPSFLLSFFPSFQRSLLSTSAT